MWGAADAGTGGRSTTSPPWASPPVGVPPRGGVVSTQSGVDREFRLRRAGVGVRCGRGGGPRWPPPLHGRRPWWRLGLCGACARRGGSGGWPLAFLALCLGGGGGRELAAVAVNGERSGA